MSQMNKRLTNGSTVVFDIEKAHNKNAFSHQLRRSRLQEPNLVKAFTQLFSTGWRRN